MTLIDYDKWQEIFNSLRRHPLRTLLTAFGVAWGIFTLVLMFGAINGLITSFEYDFRDDAVNSLWLWTGQTSKVHNGLNKGRQIKFENSDYDFLIENYPEVEAITGRFYLSSDRLIKHKKEAYAFDVRSVHPGHQILENTIIKKGRYINEKDLAEFRKVAVIGALVKEQLFDKKQEAIGKEILIGGVIHKVVGVFTDSGGENEMKKVYIPITTAQKVYFDGKRIHQLMLAGGDLTVEEMSKLEEQLRKDFAARKNFDPSDRRALRINNRAERYEEFNSLFTAFTALTWIIGILSIIAGVISISNIMLVTVKDRTKEIGIRKAIGASPRSIVVMILQEAIFLTAIAGYVGMLFGLFIIYMISDVESDYFRHPTVPLNIIIGATIVLIISGGLAGLLPAIKAARINPVIAMKSD